jgi:hypothetical protein
MRYDFVIRNGAVIDGLRLPRFRATFADGACTGATPGAVLTLATAADAVAAMAAE